MEAVFVVVALILGAYSTIIVLLKSPATETSEHDQEFLRSIIEYERAASKFHRD